MGGGGAEGAAAGWAAPLLVLTITAKKETKVNAYSSLNNIYIDNNLYIT